MRLFATAAALAAIPLTLSPAAAQVAQTIVADGTLLDVVAEGHTTRIPDIATIRAGVVTQAPTAAAAMAENAARINRVLAALKRAGVADRDLQTASIGLSPQYKYADNQAPVLTGYQATNSVSVRFRDIAKSGAILDALVAEGANQIDGPNLSLDNPDAALHEARTDAVKRAQARAQLYAKAAGLTVARILSIAESGENAGSGPPVVYAARMQDASSKVVAGERDVTVNLSVRFLLK
ncbi:SIMPL domain-containing protein [soil metagenome]